MYKIVQFTDLHIGSYPFDEDDYRTIDNLRKGINKENPDLIVLTGDNIWSEGIKDPLKGYQLVIDVLNEFDVPVAVTYGNHDSEENITRDDLREFEKNINNLIKKENSFIDSKGRESYTYDIVLKDNKISRLYFIDTGDTAHDLDISSYDYISLEQIAWYESVFEKNLHEYNDFMFIHIPLPEYELASHHILDGYFWEQECVRIHSPKVNTGMFYRLYNNKHIKAVFCGHDHDNNFNGVFLGINLIYGQIGGYNTYGMLPRGYRVIEIGIDSFDTYTCVHEQ